MTEQCAPKVSIGMPVHNGAKLVTRAIDSFLSQEFEDFELVISDNASGDETGAICSEYSARDARVRYHRTEVNLGAAANFNRTFHMSRGKYFKWAAHDDYIGPAYLKRCVEELDCRPDAVLAYTAQAVVNDEGEVIKIHKRDLDLSTRLACRRDSMRFHNTLWALKDCHPVFGLMRRDALAHTRLILNSVEPDRILLGELSLLGPFIRISEPLFFRALHPPRDQWRWLDPANPRWLRLAAPRMVGHHLEAIRRSDIHPIAKTLLALDVLIAIPVRRVRWKLGRLGRRRWGSSSAHRSREPLGSGP